MVIWLIGLSGAGKTAIGQEVYNLLKAKRPNVIFLDGDIVREIMGGDLGYTMTDRLDNAWRICRLGKYLDGQGIDVVCGILSIFPETQRWNRENISHYFEVYIRAPLETLIQRDSKGLYRRALAGEIKNVVGMDIEFPPPPNPDLIINNDTVLASLEPIARRIVNAIPWEGEAMTNNAIYPYIQRDLLNQPEYYMYSAYHGRAFLLEYFEQRAVHVVDFEKRYLINLKETSQSDLLWLQGWKGILEKLGGLLSKDIHLAHAQFLSFSNGQRTWLLGPQSVAELNSAACIYTEPALKLLLQIAVEKDQTNRDEYLFWLNRFLKRYEVSKKLCSAYQPSMKAASDDYGNQINFALLSLASLYEYEWTGNLKMLNTSIKLNDLLCSTGNETKTSETLLTTIFAVQKEWALIQKLMNAKGVII